MKTKTLLIDFIYVLFGGIVWAVGLNVFTVPNKIAPGGATGIATVINSLTDLPVGALILLINIPLFIFAFFLVGKRFTFKTAATIILTSMILDFSATFLPTFTEDRFLAALFGGVLSGIGLGIIYIRGIATGGSDLLARIIDKKIPFFSYAKTILIIDAAVVVFAAVVYRDWKALLYASITVSINTFFVEKVLSGLTEAKLVYIITDKEKEISDYILKKMKRGATVLPAKGCYTGNAVNMLLVTVKNYELPGLKRKIKEEDRNAFMIIAEATEILGNGFPTTDV